MKSQGNAGAVCPKIDPIVALSGASTWLLRWRWRHAHPPVWVTLTAELGCREAVQCRKPLGSLNRFCAWPNDLKGA